LNSAKHDMTGGNRGGNTTKKCSIKPHDHAVTCRDHIRIVRVRCDEMSRITFYGSWKGGSLFWLWKIQLL